MWQVQSPKVIVHINVGDQPNKIARHWIDVAIETKLQTAGRFTTEGRNEIQGKLSHTTVLLRFEASVGNGRCGKIVRWYLGSAVLGGQGKQSIIAIDLHLRRRVFGSERLTIPEVSYA